MALVGGLLTSVNWRCGSGATAVMAEAGRTGGSVVGVADGGTWNSTKTADGCFVQIDVKVDEDLIGPGARPGTVPTDLEQATGLDRLEILGKMESVDIFDMRPLDASRLGKLADQPDREIRG